MVGHHVYSKGFYSWVGWHSATFYGQVASQMMFELPVYNSEWANGVMVTTNTGGQGHSGSPLFNAAGLVISVYLGGTLPNGPRVSYALPYDHFSEFAAFGVQGILPTLQSAGR